MSRRELLPSAAGPPVRRRVRHGDGRRRHRQGNELYRDESRKEVLLFSNDRDIVERGRAHWVKPQRVVFPEKLPQSVEASWTTIQDTLYVLVVLFGVLTLTKVTLYGVWKGKGGQA